MMNEPTQLKTSEEHGSVDPDTVAGRRRRLLKLGVSAAPLVLTLSSRSALACHCKSPSAAGSVTHASHRPGERNGIDISADVKTYQGWKDYWAQIGNNVVGTGNVSGNTELKNVPSIGAAFPTATTKIRNLNNQFRIDIVTAYMNLSNSPTARSNCLSIEKLAVMASGSYHDPATGVSFDNRSEIQTYLATFGLLGY